MIADPGLKIVVRDRFFQTQELKEKINALIDNVIEAYEGGCDDLL
jgi:hypothetical protein